MYQENITLGNAVDQIHDDLGYASLDVSAESQPVYAAADHPQEHSFIGTGDAPPFPIAGSLPRLTHSITLALSSSSSNSYSAPICSSSLSVAWASASSTFDRAKPT